MMVEIFGKKITAALPIKLRAALSPTTGHEATGRIALHEHQPERPTASKQASRLGSEKDSEARLSQLLKAYGKLAARLEEADPSAWDSAALMSRLLERLDRDEDLDDVLPSNIESPSLISTSVPEPVTPVTAPWRAQPNGFYPSRDRVRIGIASMPGRELGLKIVLERLHVQADEIFVYLNSMTSVPKDLPNYPNVTYFLGPDVGDRGKFFFLEGFEGYYITCDDDIEYAPFHVHSIIDGIERYDRKAVVGWHGSIFKENFEEFYNPKSRQVLSFRTLRGKDTPVHLLGTGVCGFHTSSVKISFEDFKYPNMADAFLAIAAKKQNVPMVVLAHQANWAKPIDQGPSISSVSLKKDRAETKSLDVATTVTQLIKTNGPWSLPSITASYNRANLSVAFIGRTDKERWKKGGILKSAHLTADLLNRFGVNTILEDIETGDPVRLHDQDADIVMVYVGDPERPDFASVEKIVEIHAEAGRKVLVNFSLNGVERRTAQIVSKMNQWRSKHGRSIRLMVFTEAAFTVAGLQPIKDLMVLIPKTLAMPDPPTANFRHSEGIFLGDIAKLSDESLLDYPAHQWIKAIRESLPGVPLYAVKQYAPKKQIPLDIDEVWPFLDRDQFARKISKARLMISAVKYATFEMVPLEVASLGVPVIYPSMPQSLSEYIGLSGLRVDSPGELASILPALYHDPIVWRSFSDSAIQRARSAELNQLAGQTYLRLLSVLND